MADIGGAVASKVVDSLFVVAKKEISYMWNCKENVEKFKKEVGKLKDMRGRIQQQIEIADGKGDKLIDGVQEWVKTADAEILQAEEFLKQEANAKKSCCKVGLCGNWGTLHRYGKGATKKAPSLLEHQERGKDFVTCVSVETRAPGPQDVYQNKDLDGIDTHNSALGDILKSLEDDNIQIIGIYGLGGVGKTTLAKEVVSKVKNTLFADVAFTTVSQKVKAKEIKKDLESATKRIMKGDKILIILDDVWEKLDLEELCIPCGSKHKNCKILLTSRSERVCEKMNAQSNICVNSLPAKEAWILFKRVVGKKVETDADLKPVAEEVAKECGGLPLLIQAVGSSLKNASISSWKAALSQLKKAAPSEIDPDIREAFTSLQLSYEYLKSEEAKSCFLLCSMFPEDDDISLEALVYYMVGLGKFDELDSIEDARDRVQNAVNMLTSSCLLLDTQREGCTKMHDVVRDVALLITSKGENKYLVKAGKGLIEWLPREDSLKGYTGISLMNNSISKLPNYEVHLSSLDIFLVNDNEELSMISDEFIEGMKEVKVLDMGRCWNAQLPQSLKLLTKLRMLNLRGNQSFHDISIIGEMKELEILILEGTGIKEIPQEIGRLVNLRKLEVNRCMIRVTPGVISKLRSLEELFIDLSCMSEGVIGCTAEIMKLSKLTYLGLRVNSLGLIHEGFNSEKLKGFVIQIGDFNRAGYEPRRSDRYLIISRQHLVIPLLKWLKKLIEGSRPRIILNEIGNLKNIMPDLYDEGFNKLEHIELWGCPNVSCILDDDDESTIRCDWDEGKTPLKKYFTELKHLELSNLDKLEVIWKCPDEYLSLTNLVTLSIYRCNKLVRVFTVSVAQGLVNLKGLSIQACFGLEEVFWGGDGGEKIVFPSLAKIDLWCLPRLESFFNSAGGDGNGNGNCSSIIKYPSLVYVSTKLCSDMKKWGPGIHETPNLKTLFGNDNHVLPVQILLDGPCAINEAVEKAYTKYQHESDDESNKVNDDDDDDDDDDNQDESDDESNDVDDEDDDDDDDEDDNDE